MISRAWTLSITSHVEAMYNATGTRCACKGLWALTNLLGLPQPEHEVWIAPRFDEDVLYIPAGKLNALQTLDGGTLIAMGAL